MPDCTRPDAVIPKANCNPLAFLRLQGRLKGAAKRICVTAGEMGILSAAEWLLEAPRALIGISPYERRIRQ
jgi:hypothetical protein